MVAKSSIEEETIGASLRVIFDEGGEILGVCPAPAAGAAAPTTPSSNPPADIIGDDDTTAGWHEEEAAEGGGRRMRLRHAARDDADGASASSSSADDDSDDDWLALVATVGKSSECSTRSTADSTSRDDSTGGGGGVGDGGGSMPAFDGGDASSSRRTSPTRVSVVRKMEGSDAKNRSGRRGRVIEDGRDATMPATGGGDPVSREDGRGRDDGFWLAVGKMRGVRETMPLGGPKYYVVSITKMGEARIVHEAMPAVMDAQSSPLRGGAVCEERGFEIIEFDYLLEEEGSRDERGGGYFACGAGEFLNPNCHRSTTTTKNDGSAGCASPTVARVRSEVVAEPELVDWTNSDVFFHEEQSVISDCTYDVVSVESEPTSLSTMDIWLTGGSEDDTEAWSGGDALGFTLYDCCHPVAFD